MVNDPEYVKFVQQQGAEPALMTPEEVTTLMRNDLERWGKLTKAIRITAD